MPHRKIAKIQLQTILSSRQSPAVETRVFSLAGVEAWASIASHGLTRVVDLKKIEEKINKLLLRLDLNDQEVIDDCLNKLKPKTDDLSGTAVLATSVAVARLAGKVNGISLHSHLRDNSFFSGDSPHVPALVLTLAESANQRLLLIVPSRVVGQKNFRSVDEQIEFALRAFWGVGRASEKISSGGTGSHGGFLVDTVMNNALWKLVAKVLQRQKIKLGKDVFLGFDINAPSILDAKSNRYKIGDGPALNEVELIQWYRLLGKEYAVQLLIDPLATDKSHAWSNLTLGLLKSQLVSKRQVAFGNTKSRQNSDMHESIDGVSLKLNETTTVSEALSYLTQAKHLGLARIFEIDGNETEDSALVDLALAVKCEFLDLGGPLGSEHATKYNRLLTIAKREHL